MQIFHAETDTVDDTVDGAGTARGRRGRGKDRGDAINRVPTSSGETTAGAGGLIASLAL